MPGLVEQLQAQALDMSVGVSTLLRKVKVAAVKLKLADTVHWADAELNGYTDPVPPYRMIVGRSMARDHYIGWHAIVGPPELGKSWRAGNELRPDVAYDVPARDRAAESRKDARRKFPPLHSVSALSARGPNRVLLNEEVHGEGLMRAPRPVEAGEAILRSDIEYLEAYELPDDFLDCGHFTIIGSGDGWRMFSNVLSGRAKAKDMLELGNIDAAFVALFNKLGQQRPGARYGGKPHRPPLPDVDSLDLVEAMIERGLEQVRKATDRRDEGAKASSDNPASQD